MRMLHTVKNQWYPIFIKNNATRIYKNIGSTVQIKLPRGICRQLPDFVIHDVTRVGFTLHFLSKKDILQGCDQAQQTAALFSSVWAPGCSVQHNNIYPGLSLLTPWAHSRHHCAAALHTAPLGSLQSTNLCPLTELQACVTIISQRSPQSFSQSMD